MNWLVDLVRTGDGRHIERRKYLDKHLLCEYTAMV